MRSDYIKKGVVSIDNEKELFISDVVDLSLLDISKFNLIVAGCGAGKSHFVLRNLLPRFPDVLPQEVMIVTSRALTCEQQARVDGVNRLDWGMVDFWNGGGEFTDAIRCGITVCFYGDIIQMVNGGVFPGHLPLEKIKILVFDECHSLFSDRFITGMDKLCSWIVSELALENKVIIGMTATPSIIYYYNDRGKWGAELNHLNARPLYKYRARNFMCTDFNTIPYLITTNRLPGRTMIMCVSVADCFKLQSRIPNSAVLISASAKEYDRASMDPLRRFIAENETLPDSFLAKLPNGGYEQRALDVLICTSTAREGFNIRECSGVRNIISCFADELHVTQFAGRCRYNLDNIIVADVFMPADNRKVEDYLALSRLSFRDYMRNENHSMWTTSIAHLRDSSDMYGIRRFVLGSDEVRFCDYINGKWLVPSDASPDEARKYWIWKKEDQKEIVSVAINCRVLNVYPSQYTFNRVIRHIKNDLCYDVHNGRANIDGERRSYKLIVGYDESRQRCDTVKEIKVS